MTPQSATEEPPTLSSSDASRSEGLIWRVHLARRDPRRLPVVGLTMIFAALCVWMIFHAYLPVAAAVLLLCGAVQEYLLPSTYTLTPESACQQTGWSRHTLKWTEMQRCVLVKGGVLLSPLPRPSRMDSFRGVFLRYAPQGEMGDRASVLAHVAQYAPHLSDKEIS
jgi:hypothetical protein